MTRSEPLCFYCKHIASKYDDEHEEMRYYCKAYPEGIPEAVLGAGHFKPKPGDHGVRFEQHSEVQLPKYLESQRDDEDENYREYAEYYGESNGNT